MSRSAVLRVAVFAPVARLFDYLAPEEGADMLVPGMRVRAPFGRATRTGILLGPGDPGGVARERLKRLEPPLDPEPLLGPEDLDLLLWAASYYQHPVGEVLAAALPAMLRGPKPWPRAAARGWRLTDRGRELDSTGIGRAPRRAAVLDYLGRCPEGVPARRMRDDLGDCRAVLRALATKGWVEACDPPPEPSDGEEPVAPAVPVLNTAQRTAVEAAGRAVGTYRTFLVDGVTGSGKTEVYLSLIERVLATGRRALVLVPEIGLTPQLVRRFRRRIHRPMALLHSRLSEGERARAWLDARAGRVDLVVGTRSAVLTPVPGLGLIVVDEEHDLSFKQQDGFRYSARDLAVARGRRAGCPVVLGSATPSLESLRNARLGRYTRLDLPDRAGSATPPRLDLIDIRSVRLEAGLSPVLLRMVGEELARGNQVLLFLNRRGYAPVLTCHDCGWVSECRRCDARMTLHAAGGLLWCHHCGAQRAVDSRCPECGATDLRALGQGTERLEEALCARFPDAGVVRVDRDSTRRKGQLEALLSEVREGRHSLLLGTQMLAKGHHFPGVTLVGVLDVDQGLLGADFRASERMAQLIVQVAGRAGRAERPGRVLVQTRHPDHPLLQTLIRQGYAAFARRALDERRAAGLPPFAHQALLRAEAATADGPAAFLEEAAALARGLAGPSVELWGPVPAPMERRAGRFRAHLLVQTPRRSGLQAVLTAWMPRLAELKTGRRVRWSLDVDPQEML